jgi:predicted nucleotidyltransferase
MLEAIRGVLAWAAVFNHALTAAEVRQHLATSATLAEVEEALGSAPFITSTHARWHLTSSAYTAGGDAERRKHAQAHLKEVGPVLAQLAASPTVEAMAITGSVAAGVNEDDGDVDLLIIARPGHVWRVRALAIYLQHNVEGGHRICPNMVLDRDNLDLRPSVYAARELAMLRPLKGEQVFDAMMEHNAWFNDHLPNAAMREPLAMPSPSGGMPWWWAVMRTPLAGRWAERWESDRRIRELRSSTRSDETTYARDRCIGHENAHRSRIEQSMAQILEEASA